MSGCNFLITHNYIPTFIVSNSSIAFSYSSLFKLVILCSEKKRCYSVVENNSYTGAKILLSMLRLEVMISARPDMSISYFISFQISRLNIAKTKHMVNNISLNVYDLWPGFFFALCFTCQDDFCHIVSDRIQIQSEYICRAHPQTGCIHTWVAAKILAF